MKIIAALFVLLTVSSGCAQVQDGSIDWYNDLNRAKEAAVTQSKPLLIDFYADWCVWCKRMDKETYADGKVAEAAKRFICVKIDADKNRGLLRDYNVRGLPSTAFLRADGSLIEVVSGYLPPDKFLSLMNETLSNASL